MISDSYIQTQTLLLAPDYTNPLTLSQLQEIDYTNLPSFKNTILKVRVYISSRVCVYKLFFFGLYVCIAIENMCN